MNLSAAPVDAPTVDRLVMHNLQSVEDANARRALEPLTDSTFAADVRRGLTAPAKHLPPKYFYDELGSQLFEAICLTPEYYITRAEDEILAHHADEIMRCAALDGSKFDSRESETASLSLLELGSGSGTKTRRIIEAALRRQPALHYSPVDISVSALERSASVLLQTYPSLRITGYAADYHTALRTLAQDTEAKLHEERTLALFLGSNIGNFTRAEAADFLRDLRGVLEADDALLIGADLRKDREVLEAAYDDALGITAAFNLNLLVRMNRELGANFHVEFFRHVAAYSEEEGRVEMYIESRRSQCVRLAALDLAIEFAAGERIHTENSYKYDLGELDRLATSTGFVRDETWFDEARRFSSNLFRAAV